MGVGKENTIKDVCTSVVFKALFQVEGKFIKVTNSYAEYNCNYHAYMGKLLQAVRICKNSRKIE